MTPHAQPMTAEDIERIRKLAEKATPGPWTTITPENSLGTIDTANGEHRLAQAQEISTYDTSKGSPIRRANAAHIAACDPQTILALCALAAKGLAEKDTQRLDYLESRVTDLHGEFFYNIGKQMHWFKLDGQTLRDHCDAALSDQAKGLAAQEGEDSGVR